MPYSNRWQLNKWKMAQTETGHSSNWCAQFKLAITNIPKYLWGHRLVILASLLQKVIATAHQACKGIIKTTQCIREKVWFPDIDKLAEDAVKSCIPCQASFPGPKWCEPLQPTSFPPEPWSFFAVDFAGPFPSGNYLPVSEMNTVTWLRLSHPPLPSWYFQS